LEAERVVKRLFLASRSCSTLCGRPYDAGTTAAAPKISIVIGSSIPYATHLLKDAYDIRTGKRNPAFYGDQSNYC